MLADATILVGVGSSDLVSLLFMPLKAVVVEVTACAGCACVVYMFRDCKSNMQLWKTASSILQPLQCYPLWRSGDRAPNSSSYTIKPSLFKYTFLASSSHIQGAVQASNALVFDGFAVDMDMDMHSQGIITTWPWPIWPFGTTRCTTVTARTADTNEDRRHAAVLRLSPIWAAASSWWTGMYNLPFTTCNLLPKTWSWLLLWILQLLSLCIWRLRHLGPNRRKKKSNSWQVRHTGFKV